MSPSATLDTPAVSVEPGGTADVPLQIRNSGSTVEEYRFEIVGPCAAWTTVEPERVSLYPDTSETVTVRLRPPRESGVAAGESPYGVRVVPKNDPEQAVVPEGTVTVLPFADVTAELLPRSSHAARKGKHRIAVDNRGNTPITTKLVAQPGSQRAVPKFSQGEFTIAPGRAQFADLTMSPAKVIWFGTPRTHAFQVAVTSAIPAPPPTVAKASAPTAETPEPPSPPEPVLLEGTFEQRALLPRWLPRAVVAVAVVAGILVGLWFSVLRPTVRSAAREAVTPEVVNAAAEREQQKNDPEKGGTPAPTPPNGTGPDGTANGGQPGATDPGQQPGGPQPGNSPGTSPNPTPAPSAKPTSTRLEATDAAGGSSSSAAYDVPAGQTFELTDLVVQNPQGDAGTLVISNQDKPILSLALENFRDLDYHFVTPVVVPGGAQLTMTVTCHQVGRPVAAPAPAGCVESLLLGGVLKPTP